MIRTLVVDDEKLARQGLIVTMPWGKFGMRVVGEANHGRSALEFLERNEIDLLVTDLTMPIMDGLELMRIVRSLYPRVWIVVLTCHQDFSCIQEALRLGAIDYIVKTQLDLEGMEDVLARVADRIGQEQHKRPYNSNDHGWVLAQQTTDKSDVASFEQWQAKERWPVIEAGERIWYVPAAEKDEEAHLRSFSRLPADWLAVRLTGLDGSSLPSITETIRKHFHDMMFYECEPGKKYYELPFSALAVDERAQEWTALQDKWLSLGWVLDDGAFADLSSETARLKPLRSALAEVIQAAVVILQDIGPAAELVQLPNDLPALTDSWHGCLSRLNHFRALIARTVSGLPYSNDMIIRILKVIRYIRCTDHFRLSRDEAAAMVHMSSGYFSQSFKDITGKPFGDYLQSLQIAKAKTLLRSTKQPIYRIAEQSGYLDEKYFCRIFRKHVGANPADYRRTIKQSVT